MNPNALVPTNTCRVRLTVEAPQHVRVLREEIVDEGPRTS